MFRAILLLAGLIMVTVAPAAEPAISPSSPLFLQGQADRQAWEAWFNAQAGEFRAGAEYWVTHRSDAKPVSCAAIARSMSVQWAAGCRAAADRLAGPDRRRKSEREYRAGWNSPGPLSPSAATPAPPLAARSVTGAGYPFGQTIVQDSVSDRQGGVLDRQYSAPARQDSGNLSPPIVLVALIAIGGACIMMRRRAKAAEQQRRIDRACYYFRSVDQARAFPSVPVNVNLQPGEVGLLQSPASLSEMRTHHYNTGVRVRIANGFWLGGSQSHSYRAREIVDREMVAITTRRIAYIGAEMTAQVMFDDLMSIEGDLDCNLLHSARRQSAMMINYSDAFLGLLLVRLLASSAVLRDNRLPTGWRVGVDRQGDQVKVRLDGPRAALAG